MKVEFAGFEGERLVARLEGPAAPPRGWALFAHCFSCSKDLKAVSYISRSLVDLGLGVMRFDFTGLGESSGDFSTTSFSSNLEDIHHAIDFLRSNRQAPQLLIGHSLGGAAMLAAAAETPEVKAVATIGAPADTQHLRRSLLRSAPELAHADQARVDLGGRPFMIRRQLIDDLESHSVLDTLQDWDKALLVLHSPVDSVVGIDHARRIYSAAKHPKSFVSLHGADHLLGRREDAVYAARVMATWVEPYLRSEKSPGPETTSAVGAPEPGRVVVGNSRSERFTQVICAGRHSMIADEPTEVGGRDQGPNPYDLLLASLGACTSMTLRMYAERKGWDLDRIEVDLRHRRIHARDCADCESDAGLVDQIDKQVRLGGELTADQLDRLMEIADRCPVHRTLTSETKIRSRLEPFEPG